MLKLISSMLCSVQANSQTTLQREHSECSMRKSGGCAKRTHPWFINPIVNGTGLGEGWQQHSCVFGLPCPLLWNSGAGSGIGHIVTLVWERDVIPSSTPAGVGSSPRELHRSRPNSFIFVTAATCSNSTTLLSPPPVWQMWLLPGVLGRSAARATNGNDPGSLAGTRAGLSDQ